MKESKKKKNEDLFLGFMIKTVKRCILMANFAIAKLFYFATLLKLMSISTQTALWLSFYEYMCTLVKFFSIFPNETDKEVNICIHFKTKLTFSL